MILERVSNNKQVMQITHEEIYIYILYIYIYIYIYTGYVCLKIMLNKQGKMTHILGNAMTSSVLNRKFFFMRNDRTHYDHIKRKN